MSLLGGESWDIYGLSEPDITDYWQNDSGGRLDAGEGRCGTVAYTNTLTSAGPTIGVNATTVDGYAAWAFKPANLDSVMLEVQNTYGVAQIFMIGGADGSLHVWTGPNTVLGIEKLATAPGLLNVDHYSHIGLSFLLDNTNGTIEIWVDGTSVASVTGVKTTCEPGFATPDPNWKALKWYGQGGWIDDLYWGDTAGLAPHNAFMGDLRVEGQLAVTDAVATGTYREFTPSTGTDHGALVDEQPPDDGATYVESNTVGQRDTFFFPPITLGSGLVLGVQLMPNIIKTDSGIRKIKTLTRSGGADALGTEQSLSQTEYRYYEQVDQVNPVSGLAWTAATVDAAEGGIQVTV